jgi:hypothetical protein
LADPIQSYLARYAEPEASALPALGRQYAHSLVIPAYDEPHDFLERVLARQRGVGSDSGALIVLVVNTPDSAPAESRERTKSLLEHLQASAPDHVLVIDRVTKPIPRRGGVGVARKIGTDVALALHVAGQIASPWLRQTDADAVLPEDYFDTPLPESGAAVFAHRHVTTDASLQHAANLYDLHMRYYVEGLRWAGSTYAYPTLGSTIAVHAHAYASVRGFPKRNAAEDFYLLNKVAKVGAITLVASTIELAARVSTRVPFGTGPALDKIVALLEQDSLGRTYTSYSWSSFELLRQALSELESFAASTAPLSHEIDEIMGAIDFDRVADTFARQYQPGPQRNKAVRDWFDGFRTLRFVHEARRLHPDEPLLDTVRKLPISVRERMDLSTSA